MTLRNWRRVAMALVMVALPVLTVGCTDNPREPGGGGKASGTTERGGGVTSASPGGGNVQPGESSNEAVR